MDDRRAVLLADDTRDQYFDLLDPPGDLRAIRPPSEEWSRRSLGLSAAEYCRLIIDLYSQSGRLPPVDVARDFLHPSSQDHSSQQAPPWLSEFLEAHAVALRSTRDPRSNLVEDALRLVPHLGGCADCWESRLEKARFANAATRLHAVVTGLLELGRYGLADVDGPLAWAMQTPWTRMPPMDAENTVLSRLWPLACPCPDFVVGFRCARFCPQRGTSTSSLDDLARCDQGVHDGLAHLDQSLCPTDPGPTHVALPFFAMHVVGSSDEEYSSKVFANLQTAACALHNMWQLYLHGRLSILFAQRVRFFSAICSPHGITFSLHRATPRSDGLRLRFRYEEFLRLEGAAFSQQQVCSVMHYILRAYALRDLLPLLQHAVASARAKIDERSVADAGLDSSDV